MQEDTVHIESNCHNCSMRARAEAKPASLIAKLWRWHAGWCPGWKAYIAELQSKGVEVPRV